MVSEKEAKSREHMACQCAFDLIGDRERVGGGGEQFEVHTLVASAQSRLIQHKPKQNKDCYFLKKKRQQRNQIKIKNVKIKYKNPKKTSVADTNRELNWQAESGHARNRAFGELWSH